MAVTQAYSINAVTVGTGELSIVTGTITLANDANAGVYHLILDASTMLKADEFRVKVYEKAIATSTKRVVHSFSLLGLQTDMVATPALMLMHGWDMTIQKIAGVDRAFTASIRKA